MKSVLISIQLKWVEKIASGEKTIEVRKSRPKLETPFKCYIYCTKGKHELLYCVDNNGYSQNFLSKVIGEFTCDRIDEYSQWEYDYPSLLRHIDLYAGTKGDYKFLNDYLKGQKRGYGWHISDLKIYDKPKELSEFCKGCNDSDDIMYGSYCKYCDKKNKLTRPPQSWCYVEVDK